MLVLWFIGGIITYFILKFEYVMESIGFAAVFIEAMLGVFTNLFVLFDYNNNNNNKTETISKGISRTHTQKSIYFTNTITTILFPKGFPQFLRNFRNKSTQGMSIMMVALWMVGDLFKTGYSLCRNAPSQFWIGGSIQVS